MGPTGTPPAPTRRASARLAAVLCLVLQTAVSAAPPAEHRQQTPSLDALLADGEAAVNSGNAKLAMARFEAALPLAERSSDQVAIARALAGLGWAQWAAGQYEASLSTRRRALGVAVQLDDHPRQTVILKGIGETLFSMGRFEAAIEQYDQALAANTRQPRPLQEGLILSNIGSAYRSLGRLDDAAEVLGRAHRVLQGTKDAGAMGQVLTFLGIVNRARGEYDRALAAYQEALAAFRQAGDRRGEAQVLGNTANVHLDLGQWGEAIELNRRSLALAEEIGYTVQTAFAHQNLGAALSRIPRAEEALRHYQLALDTYTRIGRQAQIPWTLLSIGTLQAFLLNDEVAGRTTLMAALNAAEKTANREAAARSRYELGSLDIYQGDYTAAADHLTAALDAARQLGVPDLEYQVLANRGLLAHRAGHIDAAIADLRASVAIINDLRANVTSDLGKIAYVDTRQSVFHDLALVLSEAGRHAEALEAAEAGRARALADLLNQRKVFGREADLPALRAVRSAMAAPAPTTRGGEGKRGGDDPLAAAVQQLRSRDPELASLLTVASPGIGEIKGTAAALDATLVEYLVADKTLLVWVVSPDGAVQSVRQPVDAAMLSARVQKLRRALDAPTADDLARPGRLDPELRYLHDVLISPIQQWLPAPGSGRPVVVIPHGATALAPFAAMKGPDGVPVVDRYVLTFAPSIATYRYTGAKRTGSDWATADALIVANPRPPAGSSLGTLQGTLEEARRVSTRFGPRALVLTGAAAHEGAVKRQMSSRRVIHLATHGLVSAVRPVASSLVFAEGDGEDGYLRLDEVFTLDLKAELVVLSGCSTGAGRVTGDGILGLTRGFLYAGTPAVVASLWDVSDRATAYLMDQFYRELARGMPKAAALARAQRAARRQYPHPSLWASFVLVGEPR